MKNMKQVIEYTLEDFSECENKDSMIELATLEDYNSVFEYRFTDDCYREMMRYMNERICVLELEVLCYEEEISENIDQEILEEMAEW